MKINKEKKERKKERSAGRISIMAWHNVFESGLYFYVQKCQCPLLRMLAKDEYINWQNVRNVQNRYQCSR